jgi:hypothetical protein
MAIFNVNPSAEVKTGFTPVKPATYELRIKEVEDRNPEKNDLKVTFEYVAPQSELLGVDNQPLKGNAGSLFDYIMLDNDKQWKLRQLTEACGLPWIDQDFLVELPGRTCFAIVKTESYEGELRNKIARYVIPAK